MIIQYIIILITKIIKGNNIKLNFTIKEDETIKSKFERKIRTSIETNFFIGNPIQEIPILIKLNETFSYISGNKIKESIYNELKSNSYKNLSNEKTYYEYSFSSGIISSENYKFRNLKNEEIIENNLTFLLATNKSKNKRIESGVIGLRLERFKIKEEGNFIYQLKIKNLLKNYGFFFNFLKENKGEIIIGNYHEDFDNEYKKKELLITRTSNQDLAWNIDLDKTYFNNKSISNKVNGIFEIEYEVIISISSFKNFLDDEFFNVYLKNNICSFQNNYNGNYSYYICNKSNFDYSKFPILKFFNNEMKVFFEFNYKDLFIEIDDKIYCLIAFFNYENKNWIFGRTFLKKFLIIFDYERKTIGYYKNNNEFNYGIFLLFLLSFIIIILIFYILKYALKKPNKIKANELLDDLDYSLNE